MILNEEDLFFPIEKKGFNYGRFIKGPSLCYSSITAFGSSTKVN